MAPDKFPSLSSLRAALKEGLDFRVRVLNRKANITVVSPHGGYIEAGTSALARAVAARNLNLYDFQGLRTSNPQELHVTSTRFRDARLSDLLRQSHTALSLHCMGNAGHDVIWLGGLNKGFKDVVLRHLLQAGFDVNPDSPRYRGESPRNLVNRTARKGVQLELSEELLSVMFLGNRFCRKGSNLEFTDKFHCLTQALKASIRAYKQAA